MKAERKIEIRLDLTAEDLTDPNSVQKKFVKAILSQLNNCPDDIPPNKRKTDLSGETGESVESTEDVSYSRKTDNLTGTKDSVKAHDSERPIDTSESTLYLKGEDCKKVQKLKRTAIIPDSCRNYAEKIKKRFSSEEQKTRLYLVLAIVIVFSILFCKNMGPIIKGASESEKYVTCLVTAKSGINIREGPSTMDAKIQGINTNTEIEVLISENYDGWLKAKTSDGKYGYVCAKYLALVAEGNTEHIGYLSEECQVDGKFLSKNSRVLLREKVGESYKIIFLDEEGIVYGYVTCSAVKELKPVAETNDNVMIVDISVFQDETIPDMESAEKFLIDVSEQENFGGIIVRVGYRSHLNINSLGDDKMYETYIRAAENVGCPFGLYFWTEAISGTMVSEETDFFCSIAQEIEKEFNWFKLPCAIDSEKHKNSVTNDQWSMKPHCTMSVIYNIEQKLGRKVLLYTCRSLYDNYFSGYTTCNVWLAHYDVIDEIDYNNGYEDHMNWNYDASLNMWQFTSSYVFNGKKYLIDVNQVSKSTYESWIQS